MQKLRTLVRLRYGSQLYGTATPTSDTDYKSVHLPSDYGLLTVKPEEHVNNSTKGSGHNLGKNTAEDVDDESFALHKFFHMIRSGDMMAIEVLFAPLDWLEVSSPEWEYLVQNRHRLMNRDCKGFVGYCQRQAAKYSIKGERVSAVRAITEKLAEIIKVHGSEVKLGNFSEYWKRWVDTHDYTALENIPTPNGKDLWHLEVCDRKVPYTVSVQIAYEVLKRVLDGYGARALAAETAEGVDWKAVSHALRIGEQAVELLTTGFITFPRPNAAELLEVKLGQHDYHTITARLDTLLQEVEALSPKFVLPEKSDFGFMQDCLVRFYGQQVR